MSSFSVMRYLLTGILCLLPGIVAAAAPVIDLPAEAAAARTVALEEVWRIGGEEDEDILLGLVAGGVRDQQGQVYILDNQLSQVLVIAPDGELLDTLGREGDGPGEFRRGSDLYLTADGVGVVQGFPGKVVLINRDGSPGGGFDVGESQDGGFRFIRGLSSDGEHLVCLAGRGVFDRDAGTSSNTSSLTVMDLSGAIMTEFATHTVERDFQRIVFDEAAQFAEYSAWALAPGGLIYTTGARDEYRINVRDLQGDLLRVYARPFAPRRRTAEDKERLTEDMVFVMNGRRREPENKALDTDAAIAAMTTADDGRLFVTNCHGVRRQLPVGTAVRYDVIDPDGTLREDLTLTFPGFDPERDALQFLDGEYFLVLLHYEDAQAAMRAGFGGGGDAEDEDVDPEDAQPLEVILVRMPS